MAFLEAFPYYPAAVTSIRDETPRTKTFVLGVLTPWAFRAGQHAVIRLTDEQGYKAARDYSISSAPSSGIIEITVTRASHGEVSGWLHDRIAIGDTLEISKPLGDGFSWSPERSSAPSLLLIAGGAGIAPLMSIYREVRAAQPHLSVTLAYSARTHDDLCFMEELQPARPGEKFAAWITREDATSPHHKGRMTPSSLAPYVNDDQDIYVCGPTSFVDHIEKLLHDDLGVQPDSIFTERFG